MGLIKKIIAWGCLSWAAFLTVVIVAILFDPGESRQQKQDLMLGWVIIAAPPAVVGVGLFANLRSNHQKRIKEQKVAQDERLRRIVYELAAANQGQVTSFRFAQVSELPAVEAKAYLDKFAQDFGAAYDFTETGEIIYRFPN